MTHFTESQHSLLADTHAHTAGLRCDTCCLQVLAINQTAINSTVATASVLVQIESANVTAPPPAASAVRAPPPAAAGGAAGAGTAATPPPSANPSAPAAKTFAATATTPAYVQVQRQTSTLGWIDSRVLHERLAHRSIFLVASHWPGMAPV